MSTQPPHSVKALLDKYHMKAFLAYGAYNWDVTRCTSESLESGEPRFTVERILYRKSTMHCVDLKRFKPELCYSGFGHRKYFLNPRKVQTEIMQFACFNCSLVFVSRFLVCHKHFSLVSLSFPLCLSQFKTCVKLSWTFFSFFLLTWILKFTSLQCCTYP